MTKKKVAIPLLAVAMLSGAAAGFAGMASAQTAGTTTTSATAATGTSAALPQQPQGPHIDGNVTAINGTTITVTEEANESATVYTVDTSGATFTKNGAASSLSSVAVGDKVFVKGTATGSSIVATAIMDGVPARHQ